MPSLVFTSLLHSLVFTSFLWAVRLTPPRCLKCRWRWVLEWSIISSKPFIWVHQCQLQRQRLCVCHMENIKPLGRAVPWQLSIIGIGKANPSRPLLTHTVTVSRSKEGLRFVSSPTGACCVCVLNCIMIRRLVFVCVCGGVSECKMTTHRYEE